mmetsp:Transcript_32434/g.103234  ORF Transcript_32434/g.103234 Transcript_32434/m.103234 type:complete len:654 (-) Transcript_32434:82-2043(-)
MSLPIPKLPGYNADAVDKSACLNQTLRYRNGYPVVENSKAKHKLGPTGKYQLTGLNGTMFAPGMEGAPDESLKAEAAAGVAGESAPMGETIPLEGVPDVAPIGEMVSDETLPAWVAYDRKVLRFYAYFKEAVVESAVENYRVRKCVIYFYLEDGSIHVAEPKQENSGIPQGVFIKRHIIPSPSGMPHSLGDLNVGADVTFYGRTFHIIACDSYSRTFLGNSGIEVPVDCEYPVEPIELHRLSMKKTRSGGPPKPSNDVVARHMEASLGKPSHLLEPDTLKQFLALDGKVLRFYCVWDDDSLYGSRRPYTLHYYLADDTVEILQVNEPNSGRDPFPLLLKRAKLPKTKPELIASGPTGMANCTYYKAGDLCIGAKVNVYNRTFLLYDCDDFTRRFCDVNFGQKYAPIDVEPCLDPVPQMELPPYNGFGSRKDTKQNCISLVPQPPKKDMARLMNFEKVVLRFTARLTASDARPLTNSDKDREFIFSYFVADDTISIFEPPMRNSGILGGKFLERSEVVKPGGTATYAEADLFVGSSLEIHSRLFELTGADVYTLNYMELNKGVFPYSDPDNVFAVIKGTELNEDELRTYFIESDIDGSGALGTSELGESLAKVGINLNQQQLITLTRYFDKDGSGSVSIGEFFKAFGSSAEADP